MIKTFQHKGLERFFRTGKTSGIQAKHASRLRGHGAITVSGNWRMTFRFVGEDAELVDYQDYH